MTLTPEDDVVQAVARLSKHLNYPPWLASIGCGMRGDKPFIAVYLNGKWMPKDLFPGRQWEGFRVEIRKNCRIAPLGQLEDDR